MSIFSCLDIDQIVLSFLDIDDLRNLYQVNKYYKDKIFAILKPFIKFYQKIDAIKLPYWIDSGKHFIKAIVYGDLQICKYLVNKYNNEIINYSFGLSCMYNHLQRAKRLYSLGVAFRMSCQNGHLEIAKWLYSLGVNHNVDYNYVFQLSCQNGHLEVAQWLCTLDPKYKIKVINKKIKYTIG